MRLLALPLNVARRFSRERLIHTAASLSFTTLLGLVPFLAVALAVASQLPTFVHFDQQVRLFLLDYLLPDKAGDVIARYALRFSGKTHRLTWAGFGFLVLTALMLLLSIDRAINAIWHVKRHRPLWLTAPIYLVAMAIGPVALGASLAVSTFVITKSLGWSVLPDWLDQAALRLLPAVMLAGLFSFVYYVVPNCPVRAGHAMAGGVTAAVGFEAMQRLLTLYLASVPAYKLIYGAFAAIPIFLVWLHLSWSVILVGALIVAELGGAGEKKRRKV